MGSVILILLLLLSNTLGKLQNAVGPKRSEIKATTDVISHVFCQSCLSERVQEDQKTLREVHTYAELKHDPRASLPPVFTICSSIMTPYVERWIPYQLFFTLAGKDGAPWFSAKIKHPNTLKYNLKYLDVETPLVFPYHWVRSCISLDSLSGLVQWVVDGILVNNSTLAEIQDDRNFPTNLTGKIILGASAGTSFPNWKAVSNMVTNLNIFSSALQVQVEIMRDYTKGGRCVAEGDYLAWREMQWNLYGEAVIQIVDEEEPCMEEPCNVGFPGMASCMHLCQNLGSRAPSVTSLQEWMTLQTFLKGAFNRESTIGVAENIWVATDDQETEGEWQDFYTHEALF